MKQNDNQFDAVVVGAGFAGAVAARELANAGKKVLLLERRFHIGGNAYDAKDDSGVLIHRYGPHLFHTSKGHVWDYLKPFSNWRNYEHRVLGKIKEQYVPIPFNFKSIDSLFPADEAAVLKTKLQSCFEGRERVSVLELKNCPDMLLACLGEYIYENVFVHYTAKQWGIPAGNVDPSVFGRVPVVLGYDDRYFEDDIQRMPRDGFSPLFESLLGHENISIRTGTPASHMLALTENREILLSGRPFSGPVVYTGAIDELLGYKYGKLPYRSLGLRFENQKITEFQPAGVVNYPNEHDYTRITEFKKLTGQELDGTTTILYEYPAAYTNAAGQEPYYPIENTENRALYEQYRLDAQSYAHLYLCGRLAEYKYYNMDAVVEQALKLSQTILETVVGYCSHPCHSGLVPESKKWEPGFRDMPGMTKQGAGMKKIRRGNDKM
jgi:UDP-galactopyranose mutase